MSAIGLLFVAINFWIGWRNAKVVGLDWIESRYMGGRVRFMCWIGWLQSALGFTWCYTLSLAVVAIVVIVAVTMAGAFLTTELIHRPSLDARLARRPVRAPWDGRAMVGGAAPWRPRCPSRLPLFARKTARSCRFPAAPLTAR